MKKYRLTGRAPQNPARLTFIPNPYLSRPKGSFHGTIRQKRAVWWATGFNDVHNRSHDMRQSYSILKQCAVCREKIILSKPFRCISCRMVTHCDCIFGIEAPCIPYSTKWKESKKNMKKPLASYCPSQSPKIAVPVIFGLSADLASTKTNFGSKKSISSENQVEQQLRQFLSDLRDPVVPRTSVFPMLSAIRDGECWRLEAEVKEMPEPHRHTLAYIIIWSKKHWNPNERSKYASEIFGDAGDDGQIFKALLNIDLPFWEDQLTP